MRVTIYVANFTVPAPPFAALRSSWEVVHTRSLLGTLPEHGQQFDVALAISTSFKRL